MKRGRAALPTAYREMRPRSAGTALRGRITLYTAGSASLLIFTSALATLDAERHEPGSSIRTFGQALWWALTTITTIGYGDTVPVSTEGRFIAALLMIGGVALVGVVTATLASWIVSLVEEENAEQEAATQAQVAALQQQVSEQLKTHYGPKVFDAVIPRNVRLAEAPSYGLPGVVFDPSAKGSKAFVEFAEELVARGLR